MNKLNTKLNELYYLVNDIKYLIPKNNNLPKELSDLFASIEDVYMALENVRKNEKHPKYHSVEIIFEAYSNKSTDINTVINNLYDEYPEFNFSGVKCNFTPELSFHHAHFHGLWIGDIYDCIRLIHHAEALYKNTSLQNVHVVVYIDGELYK